MIHIHIIELFYIITISIGISAFSVHMTARGKNLAVTNWLAKSEYTTLFLILVITFNVCDFLVLFLGSWLGTGAVEWIMVIENVLEVALAYALIEMEREYFGALESRLRFVFFVLTAAVILWVDTAYTAGILILSEHLYLGVMLGLNLLPAAALVIFTACNLRKMLNEKRSVLGDGYFILYNIVFLFLCLTVTISIIDSRTETDFVGYDKDFYVIFWFVFNILNFVLIWRSCQNAENTADTEETSEEVILRVADTFKLSERELEIAQLLCRGKNNNDIAAQLFLSPNTVKVHTSNLYRKLGVKNRVQAVQVLRGEEIEVTE